MEAKQRNGNRRRRDRAARMQKRQQQRQSAVAEISENEESPPVRQKRPPTRKKRIKEPIFQEDIVDGFAFLCFKSYEDLERTVNKYESVEGGEGPLEPPVLEESLPQLEKTDNTLPKVKKKNYINNKKREKNDENSKPGDSIRESHRSESRDQLSDASSHASLERGYMCDSESGDGRGSDPECDLFTSKSDSKYIAKKNNPGHSQSCRSPPILPPIHPVVQNGTHHPEPSTAVAAVTASASPANTASTLVVGSTSPREPQIGSPAVIPPCASPPPSGLVPASPAPFKDSHLQNGYELVSDTSPPSPKRLSPKFLHKRAPPAVPSSNATLGGSSTSKPATINVYDFVSDQSGPSSPDGVIFISQSKFHHNKAPATTTAATSNGHHPCASPPVLTQQQNSHKNALDMSLKCVKQEPPASHLQLLPPTITHNQGEMNHHMRLQPSPSMRQSYGGPPYHHNNNSRTKMSPLTVGASSSVRTSSTTSRCQPLVTTTTASHSNTPTPIPARDTHSSHSNSSLSSLSQLSLHKVERSNSSGSNIMAATSSASAYATTSSLTGLVFSKPQSWSGTNTINTVSSGRSSPAPPRISPALSSSGLPLPPAHHTSPFSGGPAPPPLLPVASNHTIFTPLDPPSSYRSAPAENLFPQEYKKHPDFLRRELDTRFLASQDHSIPFPPPPYMQSEVQHHQQTSPFIAPPPMVSHSMGLSSYPPVSSLFAPGGGGASTPFVPPAHLAALQPKMNSVPKAKNMKPGKWCAMHVRIAWEIYNHQQKQKQAEAQKAMVKDSLHSHLFCSLPRSHEPFSNSLLSASAHSRSFDPSPHHSTFLNPTPAHLGPFARSGYPGFPASAPGFSGLGPLGLGGPSMLGGELRSLPGQDPWGQRVFGGGSPWGGLKEEAERDRLQQEQRRREEERQKRAEQERREKEERERREQERREQERREQERREMERKEQERKEQERKEKERREQERREMERREMERREQERREQERQKERDRELRLHHQLQKNSILMNGDHHLNPHHSQQHLVTHAHHLAAQREWAQRSPLHPPIKYESPHEAATNRHHYQQPQIKIKQERKDDDVMPSRSSSREHPVSLVSRSVHSSLLNPSVDTHARMMGLVPPSPAKDPLWGPLTPDPYRRTDHRFDNLVRDTELSRQMTMDLERAVAYDRASKLLPPPLRTSDYATPPVSASSFFSPPVSPYLNSLCGSSSSRGKPPPAMLNGLPPPLIPCTFPIQGPSPAHKLMAAPSGVNLQDPYMLAKERREVNGHPSDFDMRL